MALVTDGGATSEQHQGVTVDVDAGGWLHIRTSQQQTSIVTSRAEWREFVAAVKRGDYDDQPAGIAWAGLLHPRRWSLEQLRSTPEGRIGRSARWLASVHWVRWNERHVGAIVGVICRVGNRHLMWTFGLGAMDSR